MIIDMIKQFFFIRKINITQFIEKIIVNRFASHNFSVQIVETKLRTKKYVLKLRKIFNCCQHLSIFIFLFTKILIIGIIIKLIERRGEFIFKFLFFHHFKANKLSFLKFLCSFRVANHHSLQNFINFFH